MDFPPGYLSPKSQSLNQEKRNNYPHGWWICDTSGTIRCPFINNFKNKYFLLQTISRSFSLSLSTRMKQGNQRSKNSQRQVDYFLWPVCHIKKHLSEHVHNGLPPATTALWPNLPNQKSGDRLNVVWYYCWSYDIGRKIFLKNPN